jgi:hypothetical protein
MAADTPARSVTCGRCGGSWSLPAATEPGVRRAVARLVREHRLIEALRLLRGHTGIGLGDAKAVAHHISRGPGVCHWCGAALEGRDPGICPTCGSLNYDW